MPIVINSDTNVATVTEADSYFGRMLDGLTGGIMASDNLTGREAQGAIVASVLIAGIVASKQARKNQIEGKKAIVGLWF